LYLSKAEEKRSDPFSWKMDDDVSDDDLIKLAQAKKSLIKMNKIDINCYGYYHRNP